MLKTSKTQNLKFFTFLLVFAFAIFIFYVFTHQPKNTYQKEQSTGRTNREIKNELPSKNERNSVAVKDSLPVVEVVTKKLKPDSLVAFAKSLIGTPYKYASTNPSAGFDCSGFITYVFNHYNINVPRSSKGFENTGIEIPISKSKKGDLILFTGTDSTERVIGHMGIVVSNDDSLRFIHSSSGKANGVVITALNKYYRGRFVKTIRVFN